MSSEDEGSAVVSALEISEPDTQFIPQEDDAETLWEVIEITAERGKLYKVKWAGIDPKTKKPWAQSWVAKHDCTGDLVAEWKRKQARKRKEDLKKTANKQSGSGRKSHISRASTMSKASTGPPSTTKRGTRSSATISRDVEPEVIASPPVSSANPKRKLSASTRSSSYDLPGIATLNPEPPRPKKKRKIDVEVVRPELELSLEQSSYEVFQRKKFGKVLLLDDDDDDVVRKRFPQVVDDEVKTDDQLTDNSGVNPPIVVERRDKTVHRKSTKTTAESLSPAKRIADEFHTAHSMKPASPPSSVDNRGSPWPGTSSHKASGTPNSLQRHSSGRFAPRPPTSATEKRKAIPSEEGEHGFVEYVEGDPAIIDMLRVPCSPRLSPGAKARLALFDAVDLDWDDEHSQSSHVDPPPQEFDHSYDVTPENGPAVGPPHEFGPTTPLNLLPELKQKLRTNGSTRISPPNSFRTGIVPETQPEPSTSESQPQSQSHFQHIPSSPRSKIENHNPPSTPRTSLISKMRPKTPRSSSRLSLASFSNANSDGALTPNDASKNRNQKPLRPVPAITPSRFRPHLASSLPASTVELYPELDMSLEDLMSSIEQFSSPEKGQARVVKAKQRREKRKTSSVGDSDDMRIRGQELAEVAKMERQRLREAEKGPKKTLSDLLNGNNKGKAKEKEINPFFPSQGDFVEWDTGLPDCPADDVLGDDSKILQEMEDAYVDLDGGGDVAKPVNGIMVNQTRNNARLLLRQEEEESTQDLLRDAEGSVDVDMDTSASVDANPPPAVEPDSLEVNTSHLETEPVLESSCTTPDPPREPQFEDAAASSEHLVDPRSRSRSRSRSKSPSDPHPKPADELDVSEEVGIPPTASTWQNTPDLQISPPSPTGPRTPTRAALALLNTKSEEISKLDHMLAAERAKNESLANEIEWLQSSQALANIIPDAKTEDLERQLAEMREQWAQDKAAWDTERASHISSVDEITRSKVSAEKDRDFFRDQYAQASGYVSSVRAENVELEKQMEVATSQARDGVATVRATYELRVHALEEDVKVWKNLATFMMEKDKRTGDTIRRRAAEEPELRARCADLEEDAEDTAEQITAMEEQISQLTKEKQQWERDFKAWKAEMSKLRFELSETKIALERLGKVNNAGDEMVYRCQWRPDGSNEACDGVFLNLEELQNHLYVGGHIHD